MKRKFLYLLFAAFSALFLLIPSVFAENTEEETSSRYVLTAEGWDPGHYSFANAKVITYSHVGNNSLLLVESRGKPEFRRVREARETLSPPLFLDYLYRFRKEFPYSLTPVEELEILQGEDHDWYIVPSCNGPGLLRADLEFRKFGEVYSGEGIADYSKTLLGTSYVWGGDTKYGLDCSGFTMYVYNQIGENFAHSCNLQLEAGEKIEFEDLRPGDLIFFEKTYITIGASHVGIYLGNGKYINASSSLGVCILKTDDEYFEDHYLCCRKYF